VKVNNLDTCCEQVEEGRTAKLGIIKMTLLIDRRDLMIMMMLAKQDDAEGDSDDGHKKQQH
jgi:hypothetical protein